MIENFDAIIPVYNNVEGLKLCLETFESTVKQKETCKRLILVDDTSEIQTKEFILNYKTSLFDEVIKIFNGKHLWFSRTVNRGFKLSKERHVFEINSDCIFQENFLEEIFEVKQLTDCSLIGVDYNPNVDLRYKILPKDEYVTGHCLLFDRSKTFDVIGYLDESSSGTVHYGSDSIYCKDLIAKKGIVVRSYKSKVFHRGDHPSTNLIDTKDDNINKMAAADFKSGKLD